MQIYFTGTALMAFGQMVPATCVVRTRANGQRRRDQVVRTIGQTTPQGVPYDPERFPPGEWEITRVVRIPNMDGPDAAYWPYFIDTNATQDLPAWKLDDEGRYLEADDWAIVGRGYGIHHARWQTDGRWMPSRTTLGCINVLDPDDARWLGVKLERAAGMRQRVTLTVPPWGEWLQ